MIKEELFHLCPLVKYHNFYTSLLSLHSFYLRMWKLNKVLCLIFFYHYNISSYKEAKERSVLFGIKKDTISHSQFYNGLLFLFIVLIVFVVYVRWFYSCAWLVCFVKFRLWRLVAKQMTKVLLGLLYETITC